MSTIIYPKQKIYTGDNLTGSGTAVNPLDLKDNVEVNSLTASSLVVYNDLIVNGTASINVLNTIEADSLKIGDKYITILSGANNQTDLDGAGILFGSGSTDGVTGDQSSVAHIVFRDEYDKLEVFPGLRISGSLEVLGDITGSSKAIIGPSFATGQYSLAQGYNSNAFGDYSHAEGYETTASAEHSHAEGFRTKALRAAAHAEGVFTQASGASSHAEGLGSVSFGEASHVEGRQNTTYGQYSHAEGHVSRAVGKNSHAEGFGTKTGARYYSDIISNGTITLNGNLTDLNFGLKTYVLQGTFIDLLDLSEEPIYDEGLNTTTFIFSDNELTGYIIDEEHSANDILWDLNSYNTIGDNSHSEGSNTHTFGESSHSEGFQTKTYGLYSHAEGSETTTQAQGSHAEGQQSVTSGSYSHAEGFNSISKGDNSHAEGSGTKSIGISSHSEGISTVALGEWSHTEGFSTVTTGSWSHAEGYETIARGIRSHSEGKNTLSDGDASHSEGEGTVSSGVASHAEGSYSQASGNGSHAEGGSTLSSGEGSHSEGYNTTASGQFSHTEGYNTKTIAEYAHAEGDSTNALANASHAEGQYTTASAMYSHAEGYSSNAIADYSHVEGAGTVTNGMYSHAEGQYTIAGGLGSHAEGYETYASGISSHAEGYSTTASADYQHVQGQFNATSSTAIMLIGNGTGPEDENRSNIFEVYQNNIVISGSLQTTNSITASNGFSGSLTGTASYAFNSDMLDGYHASQFAITGSNVFNGDQTITGSLYVSSNINASNVTASNVSASDIITNYINFNNSVDPAWENGRVWYNNTTHELNYWTEVSGVNIKLGQQLVQRCENQSGAPLTKGTVVYITGSTSSDTPRIVTASWDGDNLSANTLGLVAETISNGAFGYVIVQGILKGIDTNLYNPGQLLYLSSSGQITGTKPTAPKHTVTLGQVVRKQLNNGSIYVSIQNGYELDELHDVSASVGKTNGDLLVWDSSNNVWKNSKQLSGSYGLTGSLTASSFAGDGSNLTNISATVSTSTNITGSGTPGNPIALKSSINITSATAFGQIKAYNINIEPFGHNNSTNPSGSLANGSSVKATGTSSYAGGEYTIASGYGSHAEGSFTNASSSFSHTEGQYTTASADYQHVIGKYNATSSTALMLVGNGTGEGVLRSNILEVYNNNIVVSGNLKFPDGNGIDFGASSLSGENTSSYTVLDDYEEGTWVPKVDGATFNTGSGTSFGKYTKIGNRVMINGGFTVGSNCDGIDSRFYFLPYAAVNSVPVSFCEAATTITTSSINGYLSSGNNRIYCPSIPSGTVITFSSVYETNS